MKLLLRLTGQFWRRIGRIRVPYKPLVFDIFPILIEELDVTSDSTTTLTCNGVFVVRVKLNSLVSNNFYSDHEPIDIS